MPALELPTGLTIPDVGGRLSAFCAREYAYYDGLPATPPDSVVPLDVLATVSMNSFITNAPQVRRVHRGLAEACDPILPRIPVDADLLTFPGLDVVDELLHAACQVHGVLLAVATKVLHRKRARLIPMLDTIVLKYFLTATGRDDLIPASQDKRRASLAAAEVLRAFSDDLRAALPALEPLLGDLRAAGYEVTPVRALEVLVWTEVEPKGYYREPGEGA